MNLESYGHLEAQAESWNVREDVIKAKQRHSDYLYIPSSTSYLWGGPTTILSKTHLEDICLVVVEMIVSWRGFLHDVSYVSPFTIGIVFF